MMKENKNKEVWNWIEEKDKLYSYITEEIFGIALEKEK